MRNELAQHTEQVLSDFVHAARECFGDNLRTVMLFGSGAEGQLRATSDLNLLLVLGRLERAQVDAFREPLRVAQVAAQASPLFILEGELAAGAEAFAVKFDDIRRRRRVLYGEDIFAQVCGVDSAGIGGNASTFAKRGPGKRGRFGSGSGRVRADEPSALLRSRVGRVRCRAPWLTHHRVPHPASVIK